MQQALKTLERMAITRLPSGFPTKGIIRSDIDGWIILAHIDRQPHISQDGKTWTEIDWKNPEHNRIGAAFERKRWSQ